ncbi:MAG: dihydrofolate reductase [Flavobacteriia bacterium]|jgi:dihydrofolate reductase|nr:dihydrofolate reductase [Flavobacteriia bacterium]
MKIALIAAMDAVRGIGKDNDLMWNLPVDMQFFKATTQGQIVVMGRKNYESIPEKYRPLPNRLNCVLSRSDQFEAPGCLVFAGLEECLEHFQNDLRTFFIIGGGEIYRLAMERLSIDEMYLTKIDAVFDADTFFPAFDERIWSTEVIHLQTPDEKHAHGFTIYRYFQN